MITIKIRRPDDWHVHMRWGDMLELVLPYTANVFARAMVMPNLAEQGMVLNADHVYDYQVVIEALARQADIRGFVPLMTLRITPQTTPKIIRRAKAVGAIAGKLYPDGVTTGSEGGVTDYKALYPVFAVMQELGMVLSIHCELPGRSELEAEEAFIPVLLELIAVFPELKIVVEHVTTRRMIDFLLSAPKTVGATITAHHLVLTHDQVYLGEHTLCWPHHYCKPVAKSKEDQERLVKTAISGDPRFWFGSDSAPHSKEKKEPSDPGKKPAAGVFSAPVALPILATVFEAASALDRLENFTSRFGAEFYGLPLNAGTIDLAKESWVVPRQIGCVVPFLAGKRLPWQVVS